MKSKQTQFVAQIGGEWEGARVKMETRMPNVRGGGKGRIVPDLAGRVDRQILGRAGDFLEGDAELARGHVVEAAQLLDLLESLRGKLGRGDDQFFDAALAEDFGKNHERSEDRVSVQNLAILSGLS